MERDRRPFSLDADDIEQIDLPDPELSVIRPMAVAFSVGGNTAEGRTPLAAFASSANAFSNANVASPGSADPSERLLRLEKRHREAAGRREAANSGSLSVTERLQRARARRAAIQDQGGAVPVPDSVMSPNGAIGVNVGLESPPEADIDPPALLSDAQREEVLWLPAAERSFGEDAVRFLLSSKWQHRRHGASLLLTELGANPPTRMSRPGAIGAMSTLNDLVEHLIGGVVPVSIVALDVLAAGVAVYYPFAQKSDEANRVLATLASKAVALLGAPAARLASQAETTLSKLASVADKPVSVIAGAILSFGPGDSDCPPSPSTAAAGSTGEGAGALPYRSLMGRCHVIEALLCEHGFTGVLSPEAVLGGLVVRGLSSTNQAARQAAVDLSIECFRRLGPSAESYIDGRISAATMRFLKGQLSATLEDEGASAAVADARAQEEADVRTAEELADADKTAYADVIASFGEANIRCLVAKKWVLRDRAIQRCASMAVLRSNPSDRGGFGSPRRAFSIPCKTALRLFALFGLKDSVPAVFVSSTSAFSTVFSHYSALLSAEELMHDALNDIVKNVLRHTADISENTRQAAFVAIDAIASKRSVGLQVLGPEVLSMGKQSTKPRILVVALEVLQRLVVNGALDVDAEPLKVTDAMTMCTSALTSPSPLVKEAAILAIVEIYRAVGQRVRDLLATSNAAALEELRERIAVGSKSGRDSAMYSRLASIVAPLATSSSGAKPRSAGLDANTRHRPQTYSDGTGVTVEGARAQDLCLPSKAIWTRPATVAEEMASGFATLQVGVGIGDLPEVPFSTPARPTRKGRLIFS